MTHCNDPTSYCHNVTHCQILQVIAIMWRIAIILQVIEVMWRVAIILQVISIMWLIAIIVQVIATMWLIAKILQVIAIMWLIASELHLTRLGTRLTEFLEVLNYWQACSRLCLRENTCWIARTLLWKQFPATIFKQYELLQ